MSAARPGRCLALALLLLAAPAAWADVLTGKVVHIDDGDSLTVLAEGYWRVDVRLAAIDAPEKGQPYAEKSRQSLAGLVLDREVRVEWDRHDRYGRAVANVWVASPDARCQHAACPKTLDVGLAQITVGLAWHYKRYAPEQSEEDRERYAFAEAEAQAKRAGLWRAREPGAPWESRARKMPMAPHRVSPPRPRDGFL